VILVVLVALAASAALASATGGLLELFGVQQQPSAPVPSIESSPARYLLGDEVFGFAGGPQRLGEPTTGETAWADAVLSTDGSRLLYEAANEEGQPGRALRFHDLRSGADEELAPDAFAPAWRADGVIAYGMTARRKSSGGDVGAVFPARVVVQTTVAGAARDWIGSPGAYVPVAWARTRLLVEELGDNGAVSLLALAGPEDVRRLADGWLAALSPDGRLAVVAEGAANGRPTGPVIRLVDTATGAVRSELDLRQASVDGLSWGALAVSGPGDWTGTKIVLPAATGVLVLSESADALQIDKVVRFTGDAGIRGAEFHEARFLDVGGRHIMVKADVMATSGSNGAVQSVLACDLDESTCARGSDAGSPDHWLGLVTNPSRPLP
jgi:hypothetical protein